MLFADVAPNDRGWLEVEVPAGNGVGTAREIARAYSHSPKAGRSSGSRRRRWRTSWQPHDVEPERDEVMGTPSWLSLGFLKPEPQLIFGRPERVRRSRRRRLVRFRRPDSRLGFAYVINNMREKEMRSGNRGRHLT